MKIYKTFFFVIFLALCSEFVLLQSELQAQIPRTLSYQGVFADSLGNPKPDATYTFGFSLFADSIGGTASWSEVKSVSVKRGLFSTILGDENPFPDSLKFDKQYWLAITCNYCGEMKPRIRLTSVGYSFNSFRADTAKFAVTAPQQPFVDSARIAGTIPNNSITSAKIVDGSIQRGDVVPTFTAPYADTASYARGTPSQGYVDSARIAGTIADSSITPVKIKLPLDLYIIEQSPYAVLSARGKYGTIGISGLSENGWGISGYSQFGTAVYAYGTIGLSAVSNSRDNQALLATPYHAIEGYSSTDDAIIGKSKTGKGILGKSGYVGVVGEDTTTGNYGELGTHGSGVHGISYSGDGVYGMSYNGYGVTGSAFNVNDIGVYGLNANGYGVKGESGDNVGVFGFSNSNTAVVGKSKTGVGVNGLSDSSNGVVGNASAPGKSGVYGVTNNSTGYGVYGLNGSGVGVFGLSDNSIGVYGRTTFNSGSSGVLGEATTTSGYSDGVTGKAHANNSVGGHFTNDGGGIAIYASSDGNTVDRTTLRIHNSSNTYGMAAYITNVSGYHTAHFQNSGNGGVLFLQNAGDVDGIGGNDFITAVDSDGGDVQFKVLSSGEVRSDVGFNTPAADFAEMFPAEDGLQAGDVLVIGDDGKLILSTEPYQTNVAGVYSTQPGFTGGKPVDGNIIGTIPLAISGIVPAKVTNENGSIKPGDLLVTSSIHGYAMKADKNSPQGSVIGKALEKFESGKGVIKILAILQ